MRYLIASTIVLSAVLSISAGGARGDRVTETGVRKRIGQDVVLYADAFDLSVSLCGQGKTCRAGTSVDGNPITINGQRFAHGIGVRPESAIGFKLNGKVRAFKATVGIDDDAKAVKQRGGRPAGASFRVWTDGKIALETETIKEGMAAREISVNLDGVKELVLETRTFAPWCGAEATNADWADARFEPGDEGEVKPFDDLSLVEQVGILTPPEKDAPQINGASIWGVRPGRPVIFRVPVSGKRPMTFSVSSLPDGVTFDAEKGILGGRAPKTKGDYPVTVTAENAFGKAERVIVLKVGDTIALTPPMGWNSWNIWGKNFTAEHAMAAAKAMDESGLGDHGWAYINLDDFWETWDPAVMPKVADAIHAFGFKAGLYSSPGPTTCGGCVGSYGREAEDARRWAEWGFDYLKYDWCSYNEIVVKEFGEKAGWRWYNGDQDFILKRADYKEIPYRKMRDELLKQDRDIVYSFCQYGMGHTELWGREAGANCWRTFDDLKDTWVWLERAIDSRINAEYWKTCGRGFWPDPDMMLVGLQRSFGSRHPSFLTNNEQYTHVSVWAILSAPLLIGTDLTRLDPFTRSLLVNDMVIAINQDPLGEVGRRIRHDDLSSVWLKHLEGGDLAVLLINRYPFAREVKVTFAELDISGEWWMRDLWTQQCQGRHRGEYAAVIPAHGVRFLRLKCAECPRCD